MAYTKTVWVSQAAPGIDAPALNNMENGIYNNDAALATKLPNDGTGTVGVTLGGANKVLLTFSASDGKSYSWILRTDGKFVLYCNTDSQNCVEIDKNGVQANGTNVMLVINGQKCFIQSTAPTGVPANTVWIDTSVNLG